MQRLLLPLLLACLAAIGCTPRGESVPQRAWHVHTVQPGDYITSVALRYGIQPRELARANALRPGQTLSPGQRLIVPGIEPIPEALPVPATRAAPVLAIRPRSDWTTQPIDVLNTVPMRTPLSRITIHHSGHDGASLGIENRLPAIEMLRKIEEAHRKPGANGKVAYACIGYHYLIDRHGAVWEGRPLAFQGAHAGGANNIGNIGICVLGNFEVSDPRPEQLDALRQLVDHLCREHAIPRQSVLGHHDFPDRHSTACPGARLYPWVEAYRHDR